MEKFQECLKDMQAKHIKINPKLLNPLIETLDQVKDERRTEFFDILLDDIEETTIKAQKLVIEENLDYETALSQVAVKRGLDSSFCKYNC